MQPRLCLIGRASGIRTHMGFTPTDFRTTMAFATFVIEVCGLDFPLALEFVFRPRPSSLYTFFLLPLLQLSVSRDILDIRGLPA